MWRDKTVLIVGAGSSSEVGFPLGTSLKTQIAALLYWEVDDFNRPKLSRENYALFNEFQRSAAHKDKMNEICVATRQISGGIGFASSVDSFLEMRRDSPEIIACAKAAIVHIILAAERESPFFLDHSQSKKRFSASAIDGKWYQEFAQICFEKVGRDNLAEAFNDLTIVSFNYDRCVERFLHLAICGLYAVDERTADEALASLKIIYPYGSVGNLPSSVRPKGVEFGAESDGYLMPLSKQIKTFTERLTEEDTLADIRRSIEAAKSIVFLGFGFHPQNMEMLRVKKKKGEARNIYGTCHGMSDADRKNNSHLLANLFRTYAGPSNRVMTPLVELADLECAKFLQQYKRSLAKP